MIYYTFNIILNLVSKDNFQIEIKKKLFHLYFSLVDNDKKLENQNLKTHFFEFSYCTLGNAKIHFFGLKNS